MRNGDLGGPRPGARHARRVRRTGAGAQRDAGPAGALHGRPQARRRRHRPRPALAAHPPARAAGGGLHRRGGRQGRSDEGAGPGAGGHRRGAEDLRRGAVDRPAAGGGRGARPACCSTRPNSPPTSPSSTSRSARTRASISPPSWPRTCRCAATASSWPRRWPTSWTTRSSTRRPAARSCCGCAAARPARWSSRSPTPARACPTSDRERVVQRFVRLENSRNQPGAGLGLSLVAAVAEAHGGRLELDEGARQGRRDGTRPARGPGPAAGRLTAAEGGTAAAPMSLTPCGPSLGRKAAERARGAVAEALGHLRLAAAWPALAPVFAASPYLAGLARRDPKRLAALLADDPDARLADILARHRPRSPSWTARPPPARLRKLKAELHLLTALADLGGVWDLDQVTGALTRFADAAVRRRAGRRPRGGELEAGRLTRLGEGAEGPVPGWFCIAMGKQGALRAQLLQRHRRLGLLRAGGPAAGRGRRAAGLRGAPDAAPVRPDAGADRRRLRLPHRPAPAARPLVDPAGRAGRRRRWNTTRASARTGSGRPSSRRAPAPATCRAAEAFLARAAALHLAQEPRLRRHRRHPFDQAPDPRPQGRRAGLRPRAST